MSGPSAAPAGPEGCRNVLSPAAPPCGDSGAAVSRPGAACTTQAGANAKNPFAALPRALRNRQLKSNLMEVAAGFSAAGAAGGSMSQPQLAYSPPSPPRGPQPGASGVVYGQARGAHSPPSHHHQVAMGPPSPPASQHHAFAAARGSATCVLDGGSASAQLQQIAHAQAVAAALYSDPLPSYMSLQPQHHMVLLGLAQPGPGLALEPAMACQAPPAATAPMAHWLPPACMPMPHELPACLLAPPAPASACVPTSQALPCMVAPTALAGGVFVGGSAGQWASCTMPEVPAFPVQQMVLHQQADLTAMGSVMQQQLLQLLPDV